MNLKLYPINQPNTPLFSVPSAAYINPLSLSKIYGTAIDTLSATQLISLHLHIHRPSLKNGVKSSDPNYAPYLAILPRNFASHPLSWLVMNTDPILLHHAPPAVRRNLHKMANQFRQDWKAVSKYLVSQMQLPTQTSCFKQLTGVLIAKPCRYRIILLYLVETDIEPKS